MDRRRRVSSYVLNFRFELRISSVCTWLYIFKPGLRIRTALMRIQLFYLHVDADPAFYFNSDPDPAPAPHKSHTNLQPLA